MGWGGEPTMIKVCYAYERAAGRALPLASESPVPVTP
jgi:hypothetical protein